MESEKYVSVQVKTKTCGNCGKVFTTTMKQRKLCDDCFWISRKRSSEKSNETQKAKRRALNPDSCRVNLNKQAYKEERKKEPKKSLEVIRLEKRRMDYFAGRGI